MEHYVTLFDSLFLPQGLALHMSMQRHLSNYKLWILCVDDMCYDLIENLNLPNVSLLKLSDLETESLTQVKQNRTKGEYCWTLTPFAPYFVFNADQTVNRVTYLDADLWFTSNPWPIFREFENSGKSVLITKHSFAPIYDSSTLNGKFCVQFIIYERVGSQEIIDWWCSRCIEWCFARHEDNKFGDQLYLNRWEVLFNKQIHILSRSGFAMAPWNASIFAYSDSIFYHFQGLRILRNNYVLLCPPLSIPQSIIDNLYKPYINDLRAIIKSLSDIGFEVKPQAAEPSFLSRIRGIAKEILLNISKIGRHRIIKI